MSNRPAHIPAVRAALGRNRLLSEILQDQSAGERDAATRQRCQQEMCAISFGRRRWRNLVAAALVFVCVTMMLPLHSARPGSVHQVVTRTSNTGSHQVSQLTTVRTPTDPPSRHRLATVVKTPFPLITVTATARPSGFARIATADIDNSTSWGGRAHHLVTLTSAAVSTDHQVMTTFDLRVAVPRINDDELLAMPGVAGLYRTQSGTARVELISRPPLAPRPERP